MRKAICIDESVHTLTIERLLELVSKNANNVTILFEIEIPEREDNTEFLIFSLINNSLINAKHEECNLINIRFENLAICNEDQEIKFRQHEDGSVSYSFGGEFIGVNKKETISGIAIEHFKYCSSLENDNKSTKPIPQQIPSVVPLEEMVANLIKGKVSPSGNSWKGWFINCIPQGFRDYSC